jgi:hypothetical protein
MPKAKRRSSPAPSESDEYIWHVQEILAERVSMGGAKELLVVWKTSWVPKENVMADGPVMRQFKDSRKCVFNSSTGDITLAVEPGTTLQRDCDEVELDDEMKRSATAAADSKGASLAGDSQPQPGRGLVKHTNSN